MRKIGTLEQVALGRRFTAFLEEAGILAELRTGAAEAAEIWVHEERHVARARALFDEFREDPQAARFEAAAAGSESLRPVARPRLPRPSARSGRWRAAGTNGATFALVTLALLVTVASQHMSRDSAVTRMLNFFPYQNHGDAASLPAAGGWGALLTGLEVWRVVTPIFLHLNWTHIFFNGYMLIFLGSQVEMRSGVLRYLLLVLVLAVASNVAQSFTSQFFGGLSGVNYGLAGFVWIKMRYQPNLGYGINPGTVLLLVVWLVICLFNERIANAAHFTGLAAGLAIGFAPEAWRRSRAWRGS